MNRHVVHALLRLPLDHVEQVLSRDLFELLFLLDGLIDRHRPDGNGRRVDDRLPDRIDVSASGEIHHGVGAIFDRHAELLDFAVDVG